MRTKRPAQKTVFFNRKPDSFWVLPDSDIKQSWFDTYGNYDENIRYITKE